MAIAAAGGGRERTADRNLTSLFPSWTRPVILAAYQPGFSQKPGVWDPLVGVGYHRVGRTFEVHGIFEGGGFGAGADVDLSASLRADWKPIPHFGITAGYSVLYFKRSDTDSDQTFKVKQALHGPVVGNRRVLLADPGAECLCGGWRRARTRVIGAVGAISGLPGAFRDGYSALSQRRAPRVVMGHTPTEFILLTREPVYVVVAVSGGGRRR